jgi:phosphatidylglycerol:prolipoprotein diacylglycerol transferase
LHPVLINLGGINIATQWVMVFLGLMLGLLVLLRHGGRAGLHWKVLVDSYIVAILCGFFCGRLMVVLQNVLWFKEHFGQIFLFYVGGLSLYGALLGGWLGAWLVARWYGQDLWRLADTQIVALCLVLVMSNLGAFLQGGGFGRLTASGLGFTTVGFIGDLPRYPTQLYLAIIVLLFFFWVQLTVHRKPFHGQFTTLFFMLFPFFDQLLSVLLDDSTVPKPLVSLKFGLQWQGWEINLERILAMVCIVAGAYAFYKLSSRRLSEV